MIADTVAALRKKYQKQGWGWQDADECLTKDKCHFWNTGCGYGETNHCCQFDGAEKAACAGFKCKTCVNEFGGLISGRSCDFRDTYHGKSWHHVIDCEGGCADANACLKDDNCHF